MNLPPPANHPDVQETRDAYSEVAQLYAETFRDAIDSAPFDRAWIGIFAELVAAAGGGPVADLGCGPGRLTGHLAGLGLEVFGVDISPAMIAIARQQHPQLRFETGTIEALELRSASLAGAFAWCSTIHTPPARLPGLFAEIARVLRPGGHLLIATQAADAPHEMQPFDHRVAPAYRCSAGYLAGLLTQVGLKVHARMERAADIPAGEKYPSAHLIAIR